LYRIPAPDESACQEAAGIKSSNYLKKIGRVEDDPDFLLIVWVTLFVILQEVEFSTLD
jgi:hypothetical protein